MSIRRAAVVVATLLVLTTEGRAQTRCPVPGGVAAGVGDVDAGERQRFLESSLARGARKARIWTWTWAITYGVLAGGQVALGFVLDDEGRQKDMFVSGARAGIAGLAVVLLPVKTPREWRRYRADPADPCATVAAGERALATAAASEARGKSVTKHLTVLGLNLVAGLVLWLGFDRPIGQAALTTATGLVVGEVMIFTQPTTARDAWKRYRRGDVAPTAPAVSWTITPFAGGGGLGIVGTF